MNTKYKKPKPSPYINENIEDINMTYYNRLKNIQEARKQLQMHNHIREKLRNIEIMKNKQFEYDRLTSSISRSSLKPSDARLQKRLNELIKLGVAGATGV